MPLLPSFFERLNGWIFFLFHFGCFDVSRAYTFSPFFHSCYGWRCWIMIFFTAYTENLAGTNKNKPWTGAKQYALCVRLMSEIKMMMKKYQNDWFENTQCLNSFFFFFHFSFSRPKYRRWSVIVREKVFSRFIDEINERNNKKTN